MTLAILSKTPLNLYLLFNLTQIASEQALRDIKQIAAKKATSHQRGHSGCC
jgi:hypothetical protein